MCLLRPAPGDDLAELLDGGPGGVEGAAGVQDPLLLAEQGHGEGEVAEARLHVDGQHGVEAARRVEPEDRHLRGHVVAGHDEVGPLRGGVEGGDDAVEGGLDGHGGLLGCWSDGPDGPEVAGFVHLDEVGTGDGGVAHEERILDGGRVSKAAPSLAGGARSLIFDEAAAYQGALTRRLNDELRLGDESVRALGDDPAGRRVHDGPQAGTPVAMDFDEHGVSWLFGDGEDG